MFMPMTSLVAQMVKRLLTMRETWVQFLGQEDLLEKEMAAHSSTLTWRIPWTEEPRGLQSMGWQRVGHDWVTSLKHSMLNSVSPTHIPSFSCLSPFILIFWIYIACISIWHHIYVLLASWKQRSDFLFCPFFAHCLEQCLTQSKHLTIYEWRATLLPFNCLEVKQVGSYSEKNSSLHFPKANHNLTH